MNISHTTKTALCYGDSNTWGQLPNKTGKRYPVDVRWTRVLQKGLGDVYCVIEPCLDSHAPLDIVIVMLGTNDFKIEFNRSAKDVATAIGELVEIIQTKTAQYSGNPAKVLLVSPILIDENAQRFQEWFRENYNHESVVKSLQLASELEVVASTMGCTFVNAAEVSHAGEDGIHFDEASHKALGELLVAKVKGVRL